MANTEGMSDEALSSLLTPQEVPVDMKKKQETRRKQSKFVQRRLNAPMGDRPSATIVRRSAPNSRRSSSSSNPAPVPHQPTHSSSSSSVTDKPLIGSIVERPLHSPSKPSSRNNTSKPSSRFASRAKLQPQANGFPSLDRPIGTFVKKKRNPQPLPRPNPDGNAAAGGSNPSSSDADGILEQMSSQQVRESIEELQSSLSPETIAFLKKRGQQKQQQQANPQQQLSKRPANKPQPPQDQRKDETREEKERIAKVLSSIKTYEDMDAAYTQEFGEEEEDVKENQGGTTDMERACRLLRSTSPRQTVWAARTVCHCVEQELAQGKTYAIGSTTNAAWPHPVTLPVSLRCLLDAPLTHNNGYALHAHVLRALYGLMRLRAPRPHAINVRDETASSESMFQQHFMEDAIPTPQFGSGYPKVSAVPIATNNDGEAMAYSTSSSATSAQQDGESFLADPMWTLLSKMRLLPRLAHILEKTNASFPVEAVVAVCGILAMLSVRSPGAAAAIAQHETLMQSLLGKTVLPPNKHDDEVQAPLLFMSPSVTVPTLVLLTHMARQSRTIAATIPFHKFGPSILALQDGSDSEQAQRKTLILWRTLLRYGIGVAHLSSMISMSIQPIAARTPLGADYIAAFSVVLECVKVYRGKSEHASSLSEDEREVLGSAMDWLSSALLQCISHLKSTPASAGSARFLASCFGFVQTFLMADNERAQDAWRQTSLLPNLRSLMESDQFELVLASLPGNPSEPPTKVENSEIVASCVFVQRLCQLMSVLATLSVEHRVAVETGESSCAEVLLFRSSLLHWLENKSEQQPPLTVPAGRNKGWWIPTCHAAIAKFLLLPAFADENDGVSHGLTRSFALRVVGELSAGEEATAAILLGNDSLFATTIRSPGRSSALSTLFMRELCATDAARAQLDHSFKLQHGFGITKDEAGPFSLESLLSHADVSGPQSASMDQQLLPLGRNWLWKILSGALHVEESSGMGMTRLRTDEEVEVLAECLSLLLELETEHGGGGDRFYSKSVQQGSKLYFLMNLCLHPEPVLQNALVSSLALELLDCLIAKLDGGFATAFTQTCFAHSQITQPSSKEEGKATEEDEKLLDVMTGATSPSSKAHRALGDFSNDLCTAFIEYGAQYEVFVRVIRLQLRPEFSSGLRCEVLRRLRDVVALLTLPSEEETTADLLVMTTSVRQYVAAAAEPESAAVLDTVAEIAAKSPRSLGSFFILWAVSIHTNDLVTRRRNDRGTESTLRRLEGLPVGMKNAILQAASDLSLPPTGQHSMSRQQLIGAAYKASADLL